MEEICIFTTINEDEIQGVESICAENQIPTSICINKIYSLDDKGYSDNDSERIEYEIHISDEYVGFSYELLTSYGYELNIPEIENEIDYQFTEKDSGFIKKRNKLRIFKYIFYSALFSFLLFICFDVVKSLILEALF